MVEGGISGSQILRSKRLDSGPSLLLPSSMHLCKTFEHRAQFPYLKNGDNNSYLPGFLRGFSEIARGKKALSRKFETHVVPSEL